MRSKFVKQEDVMSVSWPLKIDLCCYRAMGYRSSTPPTCNNFWDK